MSSGPPPEIVCDAGPLIHLDELGCIGLLKDFPRTIVPDAVWQEVKHHRPAVLKQSMAGLMRMMPASPMSPELEALSRSLGLHRGEREALQLASSHSGCLLLSDDTAARLASQSLGIAVHGTLGVLIRALRRRQKTKGEVLSLLHSLPSTSTLHIRAALLNEIIRQVERSP